MESLIKQTRVRFSGVGDDNKEAPENNITDRKIPVQRSQSSKGERKKGQNWFRSQFSIQMSTGSESNGGDEYATAVAAAAFAVNSVEGSVIVENAKKDGMNKSLSIRTATDKKIPNKAIGLAPSIKKTPTFTDKRSDTFTDDKSSGKNIGSAPSIKKAPTLAEKSLNITGSKNPKNALPKPGLPSTSKPAITPSGTKMSSSTKPVVGETKADSWEKAELAKIKERYDKLKSTIQTREGKKKEKAKLKKQTTESKLEQKRARSSQRHLSDMENIDQIAAGARAKAEENRRNEEFKVKEKAHKIRATGKLPATCFWF